MADRWRPRLERRLLVALHTTQHAVDLSALAAAAHTGDHQAAEHAAALRSLPAALLPVTEAQRVCFQQGGLVGAALLDEQLGAGTKGVSAAAQFNLKDPRAIRWAQRHALILVTAITDTARTVVADVIAAGLRDGIAPAVTARLLRAAIGLTEAQADAVVRYRLELLAAGRAADDVVRLAERYAGQLLNYRATTIARTETIRASVAGQLEAWEQAADKGLLDRAATVKVWMVTDDDRLCDDCEFLDGEEAALGDPFSDGEDGPPDHPNCRCAVVLAFP